MALGSGSIDCEYSEIEGGLYKNDKAFEKMSNLQFLRIGDTHPRTLRLLDWDGFPMTCLPCNFNPEFLVEIYMPSSNLEKLNLKRMYLRDSKNLKEVPDLSTATNLWKLDLSGCSSLVELSSSIGNATNLNELFLSRCSSLVELPSSIGTATKLKRLNLSDCSSLVELPFSIGNATNLKELDLGGCTSLVELPSSIGNLHKLSSFTLKGCSKIENPFRLNGTAIQKLPSWIMLWSHLYHLAMPYSESLMTSPHAFDLITELHVCDQRIRELAPWIKEMSRLRKLVMSGCTKLVSLPQLPDALRYYAENCEALERLDSSSSLQHVGGNFGNCCKLNQEARELIIRTCRFAVLPGEQIPMYFLWQATGSSLLMKGNGMDHIPLMGCVLVVNKVGDRRKKEMVPPRFPVLNEHLYTFEIDEKEVSCGDPSVFEFEVRDKRWEVRECGLNLVAQL
ncbi:hypothetical protein IGI04_016677 [Brassica rapa subsp. trilocularis]|uniref:Disease resistance R13L4/SHOC-2-like LRR domain-containing protein n=1 Tax=Brassica rapa subsp. trilocularis TaxID=1813537 RepID=A0ABQ7MW55_BRACM|nr:hypothetical protein IGI04_016677 [Brassica rapa subsp. trilocularis]